MVLGLVLSLPLLISRNCVSAVPWNYQEHGADWSHLGHCEGTGSHTAQSPIDLPIQAPELETTDLYLKYPRLASPVQLYNNEKSMAMTMPETYKAGFGTAENFGLLSAENADVYRLWQVNFHSPAEHTLNGVRYPLEMQMMHQRVNGDTDLAVVVVLFESQTDAMNSFLDVVLDKGLPQNAWDEVTINDVAATSADDSTISSFELNFGAVVGGSGYFTYDGSLTVPPCESNVKYYIRQQPIAADPAKHIEPFTSTLANLCPPMGNYRAVSQSSSAYSSIRMMSSVDVILNPDAKAPPRPLPANPEAVSAAMDNYYRTLLQNAPDINVIEANDTVALRDAKANYHRAMMDSEAARMAKLSAEQNLNLVSGQFANAKGYVEKIDFKWQLIAANSDMQGATDALNAAQAALTKTIRETAIVYIAEKNLPATYVVAPVRREPGESDPDLVLQYSPLVSLPRGPDSSPFSPNADSVAEGAVRVGSGIPGAGTPLQNGMKIAPNLKQPDGAAGQVPIPSLVRRTTTTAAPTTTPPPYQMALKMPIQYRGIADMPAFKAELSATVANAMGIDVGRVEVPEVRATIMYPQADGSAAAPSPSSALPATAPAAAASLSPAMLVEWSSSVRGGPLKKSRQQERRKPGLLRRLMR